jgi:hypothetical protein
VDRTNTWVGCKILTAVVMKSSIFWCIMVCRPLKVNRRFGGTYHNDPAWSKLLLVLCFLPFSRWFLARLTLQPFETSSEFQQSMWCYKLGYLSQCSSGLWAGWPHFESWQGREIFLLSIMSGSPLGLTQLHIQLVLGLKWPGCWAQHSPPSLQLHGMVLN